MAGKITMSSVRAKFPAYADMSDDELLGNVHRTFYSDVPMGEFANSIDFDTQRHALQKDAASDSTRGLENFGAGVDTAWQGVRQLASKVGIGAGPSDADIREKRAMDRVLAEGTTGGSALQIAGEMAPGAVLGGGTASAATRLGLAANLGTRGALASTAASSALSGALAPTTSDESKLMNMAVAGTLGVALPGAGHVIPQALRSARGKAAAIIGRSVEDPVALAGRLAVPRGSLPKTAAQHTGDEGLAAVEAASRARPETQPGWAAFDAEQNAAKNDAVQAMTPSDLRLKRLDDVRQGRTAPMREGALGEAAQAGGYSEPVLAHADALLAGDTRANPAVRSIASYVRNTLGEGEVTPGLLYETRKTLTSKLTGPLKIGDELSAAAKGAQRETSGLIAAIDDALDASSAGQWKPYLAEYTARSKPITSGKVLREAAKTLEGKPLIGTTQVSSPQITAAGYGKAVKGDSARYGDRLTPADRTRVDALTGELKDIEAPGRTRKLSGTMGGGSNTAMDTGALGRLGVKVFEMLPGAKVLTTAARMRREWQAVDIERHIAALLKSPGELGDALRALPPEALDVVKAQALAAGGAGAASATR